MPQSRKDGARPDVPPVGFVQHIDGGGSASDWLVIENVRRARDGDVKAARRILTDWVGAVDQRDKQTWKGPVHWEYARFIRDAFASILGEVDANRALGVSLAKAGRPEGSGVRHDSQALAAAYNLLLFKGLQPKKAKSHLKDKTGAAPRTIENANKQHRVYAIYLTVARSSEALPEDREYASECLKSDASHYQKELEAILPSTDQRRK